MNVIRNPAMGQRQEVVGYQNPVEHLVWECTESSVVPYYSRDRKEFNIKYITKIQPEITHVMQSIMGQTERHSVQPVQSWLTLGKWVTGSKTIAW